VDSVINAGLIEQRAFPCDVLWSAKVGSTGACECFGWVCGSKPLGVRTRECVVHRKLECSGSGTMGVEGVFGFLAPLVFLHIDCGCPEWVVMAG
jgi:hypothetical protein